MTTFKPAVEWFLAHCAGHRKLSPHTLKAYRQDLAHFSAFATIPGTDVPLATIDRNLVQRWLGSMAGAKPRTVRRRLATLKSMFSSLERNDGLAANPLAGFRSEVKVGLSLPRTVARSTVKSLLRAARIQAGPSQKANVRRIRDTAMVELLFGTGMRVSEAVATDIVHADMDRLVISVRGKGNRERE